MQARRHYFENSGILSVLNRQQLPAALGKPHRVRKDGPLLGLTVARQFIVPPAVALAATTAIAKEGFERVRNGKEESS